MHVKIVHFIYKNIHIVKVWWWSKSIVSLMSSIIPIKTDANTDLYQVIINVKAAKYSFLIETSQCYNMCILYSNI